MKTILIALLAAASPAAHASCLDISGNYASPHNTEDRRITFSVSQFGCDSLNVQAIIVQDGVQTTSAQYRLDGSKPKDCLLDAFAGCGTLKLTEDGIEKADPMRSFVGSDEHGFCEFTSSFLTRDANGNLLEKIRSAKCEDGYEGALAPLIYPKY